MLPEKRLPYSPHLLLFDSQVGVYNVYVIKDPFTDEVFYVGKTVGDLKKRLNEHISDKGGNIKKRERIAFILDKGKQPVIEAIETIKGTCFIDKHLLSVREMYWIKYYKSIGA